MTAEEAAEKIVGALTALDGLRPATWLSAAAAVDLSPELVQVRLIATRLPLPPLLERAAELVRPVLAGTVWERCPLRLVVTDLDGAAFA
ncbi:hypothetical protein M8542_29890 [Amycolatopsis sp. OK19-0408]|uniref:Uncharacterized protein n=1 Tax=Amycolatopsis iheyensis TaxID=2945988 RepID=A0A9X2NE82_9PSEU|nr:hypothetical protein [Amycolatopsis iheyensis]MCR6487049.1 hypothetical protein [Amycolatopsis iheyensis]